MNLNYFIFIIFLSISIAHPGYKVYRLQDYDICAKKPIKKIIDMITPNKPEIVLGNGKDSVAIISQIWNSSTVSSFNMICKFNVRVHRYYSGIYAAITRLKFRRDNQTGACIDYIEFSKGNKEQSRKMCDDIGINGHTDKIIFDDRNDEIRIKIFVQADKYNFTDPLELKMVLTSHGLCRDLKEEFQCNSDDKNSCISRHFVGDHTPNCMSNCSDEESCFMSEHVRKTSAEAVDYSNIAISAITSLIFTMVAVGAIIYTCWKYWHVCNHPTIPQYDNRENDVPTIELPQSPLSGVIITEEHQQRPPSPKDLPPSYESLFPES